MRRIRQLTHTSSIGCALLIGVFLTACGKQEAPVASDALLDAFRLPFASPGAEEAAKGTDDATRGARVALGRKLYHDKRLSGDGSISCATCHDLDRFGVDGLETSTGIRGQKGGRNAPTSLNAFRHVAQFWDGRAATVEDQALGPIMNPIEHGVAKEADAVAAIATDPGMVKGFAVAFPGEDKPLTFKNIGRAIGAFERTLVTKSRFDEFLDGNKSALSSAEQQGLKDFVETGCASCHNTRVVGGQSYRKLGEVKAWPSKDEGRFEATKKEADKGFFKVPSLLNIEKTGPYLHDGSIASLEEMVKKMAEHQLGKTLSDEKVASIVAFLKALTGKLQSAD